MTQLEDKPSLEPRAYITEVENESDDTGQLKDAQFDDQVMVYPKWHENCKLLIYIIFVLMPFWWSGWGLSSITYSAA